MWLTDTFRTRQCLKKPGNNCSVDREYRENKWDGDRQRERGIEIEKWKEREREEEDKLNIDKPYAKCFPNLLFFAPV